MLKDPAPSYTVNTSFDLKESYLPLLENHSSVFHVSCSDSDCKTFQVD